MNRALVQGRAQGAVASVVGLVVLVVAWPIQQAAWVPGLMPVGLVALGGVGMGLVMARTGLPGRQAHLVGAASTALAVVIAGLSLMEGVDDIERGQRLVAELRSWFAALGGEGVRSGQVEMGMILVVMAWVLGYGGAWLALRRRSGWPTVLAGAAVLTLALGQLDALARAWLAVYMAASAALLVTLSTLGRVASWRDARIAYVPSTVVGQSAATLALGLVAVAGVALLPAPAAAPLRDAASGVQGVIAAAQQEFSRLFNGLPSRRDYRTLSYGPITTLGGNPNLTDALLFRVSGDAGTYWRARTYTTYTGRGWEAPIEDFARLTGVEQPPQTVRRVHRFEVVAATDTLLSGGLPGGFSLPAEALPGQGGEALQVRLAAGREFYATRTNLRYEAVGYEPVVSTAVLRVTGRAYPKGVAQVYTQLPAGLPGKVGELARLIVDAAEAVTPYDQAVAVRNFVRRYSYNLGIDGPPAGADGVTHFLFDSREGYCDYYASAMAVLLRTLGVPTRYVLGYASGGYDFSRSAYQVRELNYHAWVEVYFPGVGWVPFEPTPASAIEFGGLGESPPGINDEDLGLPTGNILDDEEEVGTGAVGEGGFGFSLQLDARTRWLAGAGAAALAALVAAWWWWWWRLGRLAPSVRHYAKMVRLGRLSGLPLRVGQTPAEYAESLASALPACGSEVRVVVGAYARACYAPAASPAQAEAARAAWPTVRGVLLGRLLRGRSI